MPCYWIRVWIRAGDSDALLTEVRVRVRVRARVRVKVGVLSTVEVGVMACGRSTNRVWRVQSWGRCNDKMCSIRCVCGGVKVMQ